MNETGTNDRSPDIGRTRRNLRFEKWRKTGAPKRIRTSGLCLRRAALYPAELWVRVLCLYRRGEVAASR